MKPVGHHEMHSVERPVSLSAAIYSSLVTIILLFMGTASAVANEQNVRRFSVDGTASRQSTSLADSSEFTDQTTDTNLVEQELQETDGVLRRFDQRVGKKSPPFVRRRLNAAKELQDAAWDMYYKGSHRSAMRTTLDLRTRLLKHDRPVGRGQRRARSPERIADEAERLDKAIARAERLIEPGDSRATQEIELAKAALATAQSAIEDNDWFLAERRIRQARESLGHAVLSKDTELRIDEVKSLLDEARQRWMTVSEAVNSSQYNQFDNALTSAAEDIDNAEDAVSSGHMRRALILMHRAMTQLDEIEGSM